MSAGVVRTVEDVTPQRQGDSCMAFELISAPHYAEAMTHRVLRFTAGASAHRHEPGHDDLLFVTDGWGTLHVGGEDHELSDGTAAFIGAGEEWSITVPTEGQLEVASVLVPAPPGPAARSMAKPAARVRRTVRQGTQLLQEATADREYEVLFDASTGSGGATQFVGFIPPSGAPIHYHLYDEICMIVRGAGVLHTKGSEQPIFAGSAFHVAPRLLHSLENTGDEDLWVLGVFRPEGSPSAAFYPDGQPAPGYVEEE